MQTKEKKIGDKTFRVHRRGYKSQQELKCVIIANYAQKKETPESDIILLSKTEIQYEIEDNGEKIVKWREVVGQDLENLNDEQGDELYEEVTKINVRQVKTDKDFQKPPKATTSKQKDT